jgi:DNA-binding response OmpR family regulator
VTTKPGERILVIEDEPDILELIEYNLGRAGFRVSGARDGEDGLAQALRDPPDLVLLDLMLPSLSGLDVCRRLRESPATREVPVIMVTAKGEEVDVVAGLEAGADDYITKPFAVRILVARIQAVLRRFPVGEAGGAVVVGKVRVDPSRHQVTVGEEPVPFTATEFRLLHALVSRPGRVFTRAQLLERAMGPNSEIGDRNVDVHIGAVRRKLGDQRDLLETVRGVGYRFKAV